MLKVATESDISTLTREKARYIICVRSISSHNAFHDFVLVTLDYTFLSVPRSH